MIHPKYTQIQLRIESCTHYAFGQDPSGNSVVWAAGKAGWYEIIPSARYAPVYDDIVKAIDLIYFLSDSHQKFAARRPVRGAKVDELLVLYQQHTDYRVDDKAEAEAILEKHHSFLIRQMLEGWEGIDWARTHIWSYFSRLYPDEVTYDSTHSASEEDPEEDLEGDHESSEDDVSHAGRASKHGEHDGRDWVDAVFGEIMELKTSGHMCKRHCNVDRIEKILVKKYSVASKDEANGIIRDAAESLLARLDADADQGANRSWSKKVIYHQLQRLVQNKHEPQDDEPLNGVATPSKAPLSRRHQKSILRPSTGAGKGNKRMLRAQSSADDDNDETGDLEDIAESPVCTETPTKKTRVGCTSGDTLEGKLTDPKTMLAIANGPGSGRQQEQLELVRKESIANGRLHVNHLEAFIEGLIPADRLG